MGRTDNWGEEPLKRAKHLIRFLASYNNSQKSSLSAEWRNEDSDRPELDIRTTLLNLVLLLYPERITSKYDPKAEKEKLEVQNTINRLKELKIVRENSTPGEKSKGIRYFTFVLWHKIHLEENRTQMELAWRNRSKSGKSKVEKTPQTNNQQMYETPKRELEPRLEEIVKLYLAASFNQDAFAELDQAGETDPDRRTKLKQVFIDLDVKTRKGSIPRDFKLENLPLSARNDTDDIPF
ncbi:MULTISPECIES: hypothetical protein [Cyanophyceae]|uniref:hypothetical protein n=1 Tax=Cyanophyceae TaxID=3028117 RepID=UPI0016875F01|nr:hypothetical protein [Trichocoleus sp. FACHB-40]MBD2002719.1 hypothetical protein [Trichocoleus sp. FACHB-40]